MILPLLNLVANASACGMGAVTSQQYSDSCEHPTGYASRLLMPMDQNYAQVGKEALNWHNFQKSKFKLCHTQHLSQVLVQDTTLI